MPYARLNDRGGIAEWSEEQLDGFDAYFSNSEYVNANCVDGSEDFVIRDGLAVFSPPPEKEMARLNERLSQANVTVLKMLLDMMTAKSLGQLLQVFANYLEAHREEFEELKECIARIDEINIEEERRSME